MLNFLEQIKFHYAYNRNNSILETWSMHPFINEEYLPTENE
jgi:hypothetical protein